MRDTTKPGLNYTNDCDGVNDWEIDRSYGGKGCVALKRNIVFICALCLV